MAAFEPKPHSPQVGGWVSPRMYTGSPITPVHSPHHSITSSAASRTPVYHSLTIHEYRRQQHTPTPAWQAGATPGKKLRRKPAAIALTDVERVPLIANTTRSASGSSLRPLHLSQSAYQLHANQATDSHSPLLDTSFRSQSVGPHFQSGSVSSDATVDSLSKVRIFKTRKRLPRPPAATGFLLRSPLLVDRKPTQLRRSQQPAALSFSSGYARLSDAPTTPTPTPSSFSLSTFPQPPHLIDPSFSPPNNEGELSRLNAHSYSSAAPATPPATPAIIHYRGASFDLVNPHDSLLLHDIVTPSRDFDSSDYLAVRTSEEFFEDLTEMAPKRSLYGDLHAARAGIFQRLDDAEGDAPNFDLPLPPTPTAVSPNSSSYTSPPYSPESVTAPSPLAIKKPTNESRFSLKQLSRSLSRRVTAEPPHNEVEEQELQPMTSGARPSQPTEYDYVATPGATYYPGHSSPMGPTSPPRERISYDAVYSPISPGELEFPRREEQSRYSEEPLTSLIPDDPSTQIGRMEASRLSRPEETSSKPYYDDLDSIYPSSSVYTADGQRHSHYQQSIKSQRYSKAGSSSGGMDANDFANEYTQDSFRYSDVYGQSRQSSRRATQDFGQQSAEQGNTKTDTISKLIDGYNPADAASNPSFSRLDQTSDAPSRHSSTLEGQPAMQLQSSRRPTVSGQLFDSRLRQTEAAYGGSSRAQMGSVRSRRPTINRDPGPPPRAAPPLAPSFEYDEIPFITPSAGISGIMSNKSSYSYGDTQNLLNLRQSQPAVPKPPGHALEPSSSYSQSEGVALEPSSSYSQNEAQSPRTPQSALDQAEQIFDMVVEEKKQEDVKIPAMWARRNSGSQLLNKKMADRLSAISSAAATNSARNSAIADWETIGGNSPERGGRESLDSVADYSSSESDGDSLDRVAQDPLNSWSPIHEQSGHSDFSHMSPTRSQRMHDFGSSPPRMMSSASPRTAPGLSSSPPIASPTGPRTNRMLPFSRMPEEVLSRGAVDQPYAFAPWSTPYALSDRETEELLASGPNDEIIVDATTPERTLHIDGQYEDPEVATTPSSTASDVSSRLRLQPRNSFDKFTVVGPEGNLTGTPRGTRMSKTGSSIADNSSPGGDLSSMIARNSMRKERNEYAGFYASPSPAISSVTRISPRKAPKPIDDRRPSEMSLFPRVPALSPVKESPSPPVNERRRTMRNITTFHNARRTSRSAVPGQTKLRHMLLAGEGRGSVDTNFSRRIPASRPSTSDTTTPLYPRHLNHPNAFAIRKIVAHEHSPHLLCPERDVIHEDEVLRRKLSWLIFAMFCLLPPCIILYRWMGDRVIVGLTKGRLGHTSAVSKRVALFAGIAVNVGLVAGILVPIFVAHALRVV